MRLHLRPLIVLCAASLPAPPPADDVLAFIVDRARVQLRAEGARHDVLDAVFAAGGGDDLAALLALSEQVGALLGTADGASLLAAYKRAANILRIETAKDGPHDGAPDPALFRLPRRRRSARDSAASTPRCRRACERPSSPRPCRRSPRCGRRWMLSSTG